MTVKLTNSNDIFANSVSIVDNNDVVDIKDVFALKGETISQTTCLNVAPLRTAAQIATPLLNTTNIVFFNVAGSGATDLTIYIK
ncbi:MAG: hypothetical protein ACKPKO_48865 [Candidatus Fonsibacter sp.]